MSRDAISLSILTCGQDSQMFESITQMEVEMAGWLAASNEGEFTGDEWGEEGVVLYFEVDKPLRFLHHARSLLEPLGLAGNAFACLLEAGGVRLEGSEKVELRALPGRWPRRASGSAKKHKPRLYDYYAIPLPDGRFGHAQYVRKEPGWGDFVQVLNVISSSPSSVEDLRFAEPLFPPILADVPTSVVRGGWQFLGAGLPPANFRLPLYRECMEASWKREPRRYDSWHIRDVEANQIHPVGVLSEEQRSLEFFEGWKAEEIAERIMTGLNKHVTFL